MLSVDILFAESHSALSASEVGKFGNYLNIVATVFTITRRIITLKLQVSSSLSASILQKIVCLCSQYKNMIRAPPFPS